MIVEERAANWQSRINDKLKELAVMDLGALPREVDLMMKQCRDEGFEWADMSSFGQHSQIFITHYSPPSQKGE